MSLLRFQARHRYASGFDLELAFETGDEPTALFGPSGSGKTSVLEIIAGFRTGQQARVELAGQTLLDTERGIRVPPDAREIGFVPQDLLLFPHLSVRRNLTFSQRAGGANSISFDKVVEVFELGDLLERRPARLSGGERQRVALGRAVLSQPKLLLLDEPLAALDDPLKHRILSYLERLLAEWRLPTLFVTHSQEDVRRLARRVVVVERGRIVAEGTVDEALAQPVTLGWREQTGPANLLRIDALAEDAATPTAKIGQQRLQLPAGAAPTRMPVWISFAPREVVLARHDIEGLSARNHLRGVVKRIAELAGGAFVEIDVGQPIWAEVTAQAVTDLELAPGVVVVCLIKTSSLNVLT